MAKASKLVKVARFLDSKGYEVSVTDRTQDEFNYNDSVTVRANREGVEVFVDSTGGMKYLTLVVKIDGEHMTFSVDEVVEGFGICVTQNDVIRDITALISKAKQENQAKLDAECAEAEAKIEAEISEAIDAPIKELDAVAVVRAEGEALLDTLKRAFPHLTVANPSTTVDESHRGGTNYDFDVKKTTHHSIVVRVFTDEIRLVMFKDGDVDILKFSINQQYEVIQAIEEFFPVFLTAEKLENDGFEVTTNPYEAIYITPEGVLIGGEFDMGSRGVDHRTISTYVPVKSCDDHIGFWNHVHNVLGLVRLVPETETAMIGYKQQLTKLQAEIIKNTGYAVETY